jgi:hypothetical protein
LSIEALLVSPADCGPSAGALGVSPAAASAVFDCVTDPWFPGLFTRTETFTFRGDCWVAVAPACACESGAPVAAALAFAPELFVWLVAPSSPGLLTRAEMFTFAGRSWAATASAVAVAGPASFAATASAAACASFSWSTPPFAPGWSTRAIELAFEGSF